MAIFVIFFFVHFIQRGHHTPLLSPRPVKLPLRHWPTPAILDRPQPSPLWRGPFQGTNAPMGPGSPRDCDCGAPQTADPCSEPRMAKRAYSTWMSRHGTGSKGCRAKPWRVKRKKKIHQNICLIPVREIYHKISFSNHGRRRFCGLETPKVVSPGCMLLQSQKVWISGLNIVELSTHEIKTWKDLLSF